MTGFDAAVGWDAAIAFDGADAVASTTAWPGITVQFAPGNLMTDTFGTITWIDITQYVQENPGLTIVRGQGAQSDRDDTGECTFTIRDTARLFDPTNETGTYYGTLNPWTPVRVTATYAGITYPLFYGGILSFPQRYNVADNFVEIPVVAHGYLGYLAAATYLPRNPWTLEDAGLGQIDGIGLLYDPDPTWPEETTGARIGRLLDIAGLDLTHRDIEAGESTVYGGHVTASLLEHLELCRRTELGRLYETADGYVKFLSRRNVEQAATSAVFSDGLGWSIPYSGLDLDPADPRTLANVVTRGGPVVGQFTARDATSATTYGPTTDEATDLLFADRADAIGQAQYLLGRNKDPQTRVSSMTVFPQKAPETLFPVILAADLGSRFVISRRPLGIGSTFLTEALIARLSHTITGRFWTFQVELYPPDRADYWTLEDPTLGTIDSSNVLVY